MSRIAGFVNHSLNQAIDEWRKALIKQRDELTMWLDRYESDAQCDDVDRRAINHARKRLQEIAHAIFTL